MDVLCTLCIYAPLLAQPSTSMACRCRVLFVMLLHDRPDTVLLVMCRSCTAADVLLLMYC